MQINREDLNPSTVRLGIVCDPEEVQAGYSKAFKKLAKKIKLPGFRPGHAPRAMVQQYIDPSELNQTAAEEIVNKAYRSALEEQSVEPDWNTRPQFDLKKLDEESSACEFEVTVPLPPKADLGDYRGVPVERPRLEVTDEEVDYQIDEIRKRRSTREAVTERGAEEGDVAVVNIRPDGEAGEGRNFMTIVGKTFPQLDQALSGMTSEEMKSLDLTFPESFQEKDWAGQTIKAVVTLNSLNTVKLPEVDDSFAQAFQADNVGDLRERIRSAVERAKGEMIRQIVADRLLDAVLERSTVHVSEVAWQQLATRRVDETEAEQQEKGKTLEEYASEHGMSIDEFKKSWEDRAKHDMERAVVITEIFRRENMRVSNDELSRELVAMAGEMDADPQELLAVLKKNNAVNELHFRAISRKVTEFLEKHAEVKEVEHSEA
jgi:trigger factor